MDMGNLRRVQGRANRQVRDKLPIPTTCPYCSNPVKAACNREVYGENRGRWPYIYRCTGCDAYVGMHPFTDIPLGTLANRQLRALRKEAKEMFNERWDRQQIRYGHGERKAERADRSAQYRWLAQQLGIPLNTCHFGWFDEQTCHYVIAILKERDHGY